MSRIIPAICTSTRCGDIGCNYCTSCSHAVFELRPKVNGKMYKAWFEPYYGFEFNRGGLNKRPFWSPNAKHPLWKAIKPWYARFRKQAKEDAIEFKKEMGKKG